MSAETKVTWFDLVRQVVTFLAGLAIIFYGIVRPYAYAPDLITGFILVGVAPVDRYVGAEVQKHAT